MRRLLALAIVGGLFLLGPAPAQARWGVHRIVRYLLEGAARDRDITDQVTGDGWVSANANRTYWHITVRIAMRVGSNVAPGSSLSCRATVNRLPVRTVVEVASP
jgi:hypothetical protein